MGTSQRSAPLRDRVARAAELTLSTDRVVAPIQVLANLGWLPPPYIDQWRQGRRPHLEGSISTAPAKVADALRLLGDWARQRGLVPAEVAYVSSTRDRRTLQFTAAGDEAVERVYRTHWLSPDLSERQRERVTERQSRPPDLVAVSPLNEWTCSLCGGTGSYLLMEDSGPVCLTCAEMDHLVFLPAGDATLSRRAKKASGLSAVVVRFNRSSKRYQRQGILVEEAALERAEAECLADEEARARQRARANEHRAQEDVEFQARLEEEIRALFPSCPPERARAIATHAGTRGSGRVGRSAAGRALTEDAVTLAVIASIRHEETRYDEYLMSGMERREARSRVRDDVERVLRRWQRPRLQVLPGGLS